MAVAGDRIELLQTFIRIVEAGSLSAAAAQLGTTQPTVSRRLQALERALGLRLLQRSTHHLGLTADGERCFEGARALLTRWAAFESDLRGAREEPDGVLRVVAPHAFGQERLIDPLATYLRRYPRVTVEWMLHDDRAIQDYIAAGIDCVIQVGEVRDPGLVARTLARVPRVMAIAPEILTHLGIPPGGGVPPEDLARVPWLALRTYYRNEVALRHRQTGETRTIAIAPRFATDSLYALRSAMVAGLGAGLASAWVVEADLAAGRLVPLLPADSPWGVAALPVSIAYRHAHHYPARLRAFVDIMAEALPRVIGAGQAG